MRYSHRVDGNQAEIIDALKLRYVVHNTSHFGGGFPDLVVKTQNDRVVLMEVKMPGEKQTPAEVKFQQIMGDVIYRIVHSAEEALAVMGEYDE